MKKKYNKIIILSIISLMGTVVYLGDKKLKDEKRFIYSTGTNEVVFGDITWGMSQKEVERAIGEKLSKSYYPSQIECELRPIKTGEIDRRDIFLGNLSNYPKSNFDGELNLNIRKKSKRLFSKPLDNFLGIRTGSICYLFFDDKLFSVSISPTFTIVLENEKELESKLKIFENKTEVYRSALKKNLHSKFGRLFIKESGKTQLTVTNLKTERVYLDAFSINTFDNNSKCNKYSFNIVDLIIMRYKPIVEKINKEIQDSDTSFFK